MGAAGTVIVMAGTASAAKVVGMGAKASTEAPGSTATSTVAIRSMAEAAFMAAIEVSMVVADHTVEEVSTAAAIDRL
jgi:hypothetical protein